MKPWKKTDEKLVYDGYRKVLRRTFTLPNGDSADFDVVKAGLPSVAVLALTENNEIVCFRQFRPGPEKVLAELPGGGVEPHDAKDASDDIKKAIIAAGARELREETGYTAELEYIGSYYRDAYNIGTWHMIVGRNAKQTQAQQLDVTEYGEVALLSLEEFKRELFAGNMTDTTLGYAGLHHLGLLSDR